MDATRAVQETDWEMQGLRSTSLKPVSQSLDNSTASSSKWPKMWFSIWRPPPSWILLDTSSEDKSCLGTLFSVSVSNLVQIRSKMAELWPFNLFQNGGRRHLGFLQYVNFGEKNLTVGPHFQPMFRIWCCRTQSLESSSSGHTCDRHCQCL